MTYTFLTFRINRILKRKNMIKQHKPFPGPFLLPLYLSIFRIPENLNICIKLSQSDKKQTSNFLEKKFLSRKKVFSLLGPYDTSRGYNAEIK